MSLRSIAREVVACEACPRLREHCTRVAREKRAAYRSETYWGRPVPSLGDPHARIVLVGLAPAAHGANRTGRMFTGDRSADFLFAALHRAGFANQPTSVSRDDGLRLDEVWIAAAARCAPPGNRPSPEELQQCRRFLVAEIRALRHARLFVVLGAIANEALWAALAELGHPRPRPRPRFGHGAFLPADGPRPAILCSYHPSQQNTQTGRLTPDMLDAIFARARELAFRTGSPVRR